MRTLSVWRGMLIAAGYFSSVDGGLPAHSIAAWDGSSWHTLGEGIGTGMICDYQYVFALACDDESVVAGGNFQLAGGDAANHIARWDGEQWTLLGPGLGSGWDAVCALTSFEGDLVAGGDFTSAGGVPCAHLARWTDQSWVPLGSGTNGEIYCLQSYRGSLYAGGDFKLAGSKPSLYIARWLGCGADAVPERALESTALLSVCNPYTLGQPLTLTAPPHIPLTVAIYGADGRLARTLFRGIWNGDQLVWDGRTDLGEIAGAGVYFCRAEWLGHATGARLVRIR